MPVNFKNNLTFNYDFFTRSIEQSEFFPRCWHAGEVNVVAGRNRRVEAERGRQVSHRINRVHHRQVDSVARTNS